MFRRGHRRGVGKFSQAFAPGPGVKPTIESVAAKLAGDGERFYGFDGETERALLGDLLLCHCLENKGYKLGRQVAVERVFPTHYFSSWIDLPDSVASLRFVPEMLIALLSQQDTAASIEKSDKPRVFSVGLGFEDNLLLRIFGTGVSVSGMLTDLVSDRFDEAVPLAVDQLLTVRIAQACKEAPQRLRPGVRSGGPMIPNRWPVAHAAMENFRQDLNVFLQVYGSIIPRQALVSMLESLIGLGLSTVFLGTVAAMIHWDAHGSLPARNEQPALPVFVDASSGADHALRRLSEESMEGITRALDRLPMVLMCLRILDGKARYDRDLRQHQPTGPDATAWIDLLGKIRHRDHERSTRILDDLDEKCLVLADALHTEGLDPEVVEMLRNYEANDDPVSRLAEAITSLMGEKNQRTNYQSFLDSCLMLDAPNGLGLRRRVNLRNVKKGRKTGDVRSIILSNTALDILVHRHLHKAAKGKRERALPFVEFLEILRERYGLYVDIAPPGMSVSNDDLHRNRCVLERRLRDLGVLIGVNDAEAMKRLCSRFRAGSL